MGEGLNINEDKSIVSWVDISKKRLFYLINNQVYDFPTIYIPSLIIESSMDYFRVATDYGECSFNHKGELLYKKKWDFVTEGFRTNDGAKIGSDLLIGTMNIRHPNLHCGKIVRIENNDTIHIISDDIHIPNSFIQLDKNNILITDSYTKTIYKYTFSNTDFEREVWLTYKGTGTPDGGFFHKYLKRIFLTIWDEGRIAIFDLEGNEYEGINIPMIRPTNCKMNYNNTQIWVTSCSEDIQANKELELDGFTIRFEYEDKCNNKNI